VRDLLAILAVTPGHGLLAGRSKAAQGLPHYVPSHPSHGPQPFCHGQTSESPAICCDPGGFPSLSNRQMHEMQMRMACTDDARQRHKVRATKIGRSVTLTERTEHNMPQLLSEAEKRDAGCLISGARALNEADPCSARLESSERNPPRLESSGRNLLPPPLGNFSTGGEGHHGIPPFPSSRDGPAPSENGSESASSSSSSGVRSCSFPGDSSLKLHIFHCLIANRSNHVAVSYMFLCWALHIVAENFLRLLAGDRSDEVGFCSDL
jgi:hypothetical protein